MTRSFTDWEVEQRNIEYEKRKKETHDTIGLPKTDVNRISLLRKYAVDTFNEEAKEIIEDEEQFKGWHK